MKPSRSFASDNNAVVHPEVLAAISRANAGHVVGYGDDPFTASAVLKLAMLYVYVQHMLNTFDSRLSSMPMELDDVENSGDRV